MLNWNWRWKSLREKIKGNKMKILFPFLVLILSSFSFIFLPFFILSNWKVFIRRFLPSCHSKLHSRLFPPIFCQASESAPAAIVSNFNFNHNIIHILLNVPFLFLSWIPIWYSAIEPGTILAFVAERYYLGVWWSRTNAEDGGKPSIHSATRTRTKTR